MSPVPPSSVTAPYPMLETALNLARTRLNDAIAGGITGDILTDTQPFTAPMVNAAYRKLQYFLTNLGFSRYKRKFWAYALPAVDSTDPSTSVQWSWTQYVNASGAVYAPPEVGVLPQDLIAPLKVGERTTGSLQQFTQLTLCPDGLPEGMKTAWNGYFEWKNDAIYMPGSTYSMDFEIEYSAYDYDFATYTPAGGSWPILGSVTLTPATMPIPIMRSESALANYICVEVLQGRDDSDVAGIMQEAEKDARLIINNSDVRLRQRRPVQRRSYAGRRNQLWGTRGY